MLVFNIPFGITIKGSSLCSADGMQRSVGMAIKLLFNFDKGLLKFKRGIVKIGIEKFKRGIEATYIFFHASLSLRIRSTYPHGKSI